MPPNVNGKLRNYLDLNIETIVWKTSKAFTHVKICVSWWGQKGGIVCEGISIDTNKRKVPEEPLKTLHYQINTNNRLFQSYLVNCEPIEFKIFSSKTGDLIGSSKIEIPLRFHRFKENEELTCRNSSPILSNRNFNLGEMVVSFSLQPADMKKKILSATSVRIRNKIEATAVPSKTLKDSNKENIEVIGRKKKLSFRDPKPRKSSTLIKQSENNVKLESVGKAKSTQNFPKQIKPMQTNVSLAAVSDLKSDQHSSLIRYLSGERMTGIDERTLLQELATMSPSESIMEALNTINTEATKWKLADKIDSLRVTIPQVDFNGAGQLEMQSFMNKNRCQKCIIKCVVASKIFEPHRDVKLISAVFETAPQSK